MTRSIAVASSNFCKLPKVEYATHIDPLRFKRANRMGHLRPQPRKQIRCICLLGVMYTCIYLDLHQYLYIYIYLSLSLFLFFSNLSIY